MTTPRNIEAETSADGDIVAASSIFSGMRGALRQLVLLPVIAVVFVVAAIFVPHFLSINNLVNNILDSATVLGMVVIAETIILIGGYFDLSLQSMVGLAPMLAAWLAAPAATGGQGIELNEYMIIVVMFALGAVVGLFNGLMVAKLKLNAFIVTLAVLILLQGFTLGLSGGRTFSDLPATMTFPNTIKIFTVPLSVYIVVASFLVAAFLMRYHPTGRRIYAMGGNPEAARAAGIKTERLTIGLFIAGGMLAALGGLLLSSRIASVTASQGQNLIFTVFAAAVIGGVNLNGGRGTLLGAGTGVVLLAMIQNALVLSAVPSFWIDATYGAIILGALLLGSTELRSTILRPLQRVTPGGAR